MGVRRLVAAAKNSSVVERMRECNGAEMRSVGSGRGMISWDCKIFVEG